MRYAKKGSSTLRTRQKTQLVDLRYSDDQKRNDSSGSQGTSNPSWREAGKKLTEADHVLSSPNASLLLELGIDPQVDQERIQLERD